MSGPVAGIVVRNWGALIALVGATLTYGARKPAVRPLRKNDVSLYPDRRAAALTADS